MPIYEYECNDCAAVFEILTTSSSSGKPVVCPQCRSENTKKIVSSGSFKFGRSSSTPACAHSGCAPKRGFS